MHPVLDLAAFNSKGQLWIGGETTSSDACFHLARFFREKPNNSVNRSRSIRVAEVCKKLLNGASLLVCCRNGAHRSALICLMLLMFMTGCKPGVIADYLQRLRIGPTLPGDRNSML